jgi:hypothetical protein
VRCRQGGTDHLVDELIALGIEQDGSIAIEQIDTALSRVAWQAQLDAPGEGVDTVVWQQVEERTSEESTLSATFLVFLSIATLIAGTGVLLDQPILIVGAMVVGPEFGADCWAVRRARSPGANPRHALAARAGHRLSRGDRLRCSQPCWPGSPDWWSRQCWTASTR